MNQFIVTYRLPYEHIVSVGVQAVDEDEAIAKAQSAFDEGSIWDDTPEMPLVYDDYEETDDSGAVLAFEATPITDESALHPDTSVLRGRRNAMAIAACAALVAAYDDAADGGGVKWEAIDDAYALAAQVMGPAPDKTGEKLEG